MGSDLTGFQQVSVNHVVRVEYGEYNAVFNIATLEMMEGDLPSRAHRLVKEWASDYKNELLHMWQTNEFKQLPGLE